MPSASAASVTGVVLAAAGMDDRADPGVAEGLEPVGHREEGVRGGDTAPPQRSPARATASSDDSTRDI